MDSDQQYSLNNFFTLFYSIFAILNVIKKLTSKDIIL